MQIKIHHEKLIQCPLNENNKDYFIFENDGIVNQIKSELEIRYPSCILISGYRGSGKTSLINKVVLSLKENETDRFLCIQLNIPTLKNTDFLFRNIIRSLYIELKDKAITNNNKEIIEISELLYKRTFYDIKKEIIDKKKTEKENKMALEIDGIDVFLILLTIGSFIISNFGVTYPFFQSKFSAVPFFFVFIAKKVVFYLSYKSVKSKTFQNTMYELYDDEIAEHLLKDLLGKINNSGNKTLIIIDELDKLNTDEIQSIFTILKSIIFSNLASFVLVTGQKYSYEYETSHTKDDPIISSIFSNKFHVPLLSKEVFHNLFNTLLAEDGKISKDDKEAFVNHLILNSNRIPRRFINLVRQNSEWIDSNLYINIDESKLAFYKTDEKLLSIIKLIEDTQILNKKYSASLKDFLTEQLFLWIHLMKNKKRFNQNEILDSNNIDFLPGILINLKEIWDSLTTKMVDDNLIEVHFDKTSDSIYYTWKIETSSYQDDNIALVSDSKIFNDLSGLKDKISNCYYSLKGKTKGIKEPGIYEKIDYLAKNKILDNKTKSELIELIKIRNKIAHFDKIEITDLDIINKSDRLMRSIDHKLLTNYIYYVSIKHFSKNELIKITRKHSYSDIEIEYNGEIINIDLVMVSYPFSFIERMHRLRQKRSSIIFIFSNKNDKTPTYESIEHRVKNLFPEHIGQKISIYLISDFSRVIDKKDIENCLDNFIKGFYEIRNIIDEYKT